MNYFNLGFGIFFTIFPFIANYKVGKTSSLSSLFFTIFIIIMAVVTWIGAAMVMKETGIPIEPSMRMVILIMLMLVHLLLSWRL